MKVPAKAQRRKEGSWFGFSLRLCAFAGNCLLILLCVGTAGAQAKLRSRATISIAWPTAVKVDCEFSSPTRSWSFRNAYAGVLGIAERVSDFRAQDAAVKKIAAGEFRSDFDVQRINYTVRLAEPRPEDVSHVSWLVGDRGFLMFADLIPRDIETLSVNFVLPDGWTIESSITRDVDGRYQITEPEKAVFFTGRSLRKTTKSVDGMTLNNVLSGTWPFKDSDVLRSAAPVMKKYLALTGFKLPGESVIMIAPLPISVGSVRWRAETRGSTVVLLIDPNAGFRNWRPQLGVIFTHELLHLWVPNSLKLTGDYDRLLEGFTLYTALRTALELKIIDFKEFLNTLARVYDSYLSYADNLSLIEAAERRWTTPGSLVYDKGMLVAFLYDLMISRVSSGKTSLADRYRELFVRSFADDADGNEAIINVLAGSPAARDFTRTYIENSGTLELEQVLPAYGLSLDPTGKSSQLRVSRELDADQKRLLGALGYKH